MKVFEGEAYPQLLAETREEVTSRGADGTLLGWLDNVAIVVREWPSPQELARAGLGPRQLLLGLYVGVPKTRRGARYVCVVALVREGREDG